MLAAEQSPPVILAADDYDIDRLLLQRILEMDGYVVELVTEGSQALKAFKELRPDIVLLDIDMPVVDGLEVCRQIRALPDGEMVPIVMLTALNDNNTLQKAFNAGATDYIAKPIPAEVLRYRLRSLVRTVQAERMLRQHMAEVEAANQELEAYGRTIAHDLKAPLASMLGFVELLELTIETNPEKASRYVRRIRETAEHMTGMVRRLLWLARLRQSQQRVELVDVRAAIEAVLVRFPDHHIRIEIADDLPPALGHTPWIEEVFANLISNAIKYIGKDNPDPLIEIHGSIHENMAHYEVRDNGIGISPEDQDYLFEMFTRTNPGDEEGMGLGLAIVHRIVTNLHGEAGVESTPGEGSTFWFSLPTASE